MIKRSKIYIKDGFLLLKVINPLQALKKGWLVYHSANLFLFPPTPLIFVNQNFIKTIF